MWCLRSSRSENRFRKSLLGEGVRWTTSISLKIVAASTILPSRQAVNTGISEIK
jgi:hypothetical protein